MVEGDEKDLLDRARHGDECAWEEIVQRYHRLVACSARRILRNEDDVREVVQDTFMNAFKQIKQYRGEARFSSWLFRIGWRAAITRARATHPERYVSRSNAEIEALSDTDDPEGLRTGRGGAVSYYSRSQAKRHEKSRLEDLWEFIGEVLRDFDQTRAAIIRLRLDDNECEVIASMLGIGVEEVYDTNKEFARRCRRLKNKLLSRKRALAERSP
jgi:RNA polymerase sigma factor (sigma-70 family)